MRSTRSRAPESGPKRHGPAAGKRTARLMGEAPGDILLSELLCEVRAGDERLQAAEVGAGDELLFVGAGSVEAAGPPCELQLRECDTAAAARSAASQAVVLEQPQAFDNAREKLAIFVTENIHDD